MSLPEEDGNTVETFSLDLLALLQVLDDLLREHSCTTRRQCEIVMIEEKWTIVAVKSHEQSVFEIKSHAAILFSAQKHISQLKHTANQFLRLVLLRLQLSCPLSNNALQIV